MVYGMVANKIRELQNVRPPVTACGWVVPPMVPGRPLYDREHARRYVHDKLVRGGFRVQCQPDHGLHVDWAQALEGAKRKPPPPPPPAASSSKRKRKKKNPSESLAEKAARAERLTGRLAR